MRQKNIGLGHIEDALFENGIEGARRSLVFARGLIDMLSSMTPAKPITLSTKWVTDGLAPITAGIDRDTKRFFVGERGERYYNPDETDSLRLKYALEFLKGLDFTPDRILQGDIMYTAPDLRIEVMNAEECVTFQPGPIKYAVPITTPLAKMILASKIGIIWNTEFDQNMIPIPNPNVAALGHTRDVWHRDNEFTDASGAATFTAAETVIARDLLSQATNIYKRLSPSVINRLSVSAVGRLLQEYLASGSTTPIVQWVTDKYNTEVFALKAIDSKLNRIKVKNEVTSFFRDNAKAITQILRMRTLLIQIKEMIMAKLNAVRDIGAFVQTPGGYRIANHDGFVATSHDGNTVKLVDRLVFGQGLNTQINWSK